jgi:Fe-S-cluster formation regulator IscX/YfhJ
VRDEVYIALEEHCLPVDPSVVRFIDSKEAFQDTPANWARLDEETEELNDVRPEVGEEFVQEIMGDRAIEIEEVDDDYDIGEEFLAGLAELGLSRDDVQEVIQKRESEEEVQENKSEYSHSADLSYAPPPSKMSINSFFESHHVMKRPDRKTLELAAKTMDRAVGKLGVLQMKIPVRLQGSRCLKMSRRRLGQSSNDKEGLKLYVATEEDSAIACLIKDIDELPAFERTWGRM